MKNTVQTKVIVKICLLLLFICGVFIAFGVRFAYENVAYIFLFLAIIVFVILIVVGSLHLISKSSISPSKFFTGGYDTNRKEKYFMFAIAILFAISIFLRYTGVMNRVHNLGSGWRADIFGISSKEQSQKVGILYARIANFYESIDDAELATQYRDKALRFLDQRDLDTIQLEQ